MKWDEAWWLAVWVFAVVYTVAHAAVGVAAP